MKKWWLLLLVLVCSMFTGCKKDTEDMVIEETDIPGVKVVDLTCAYEYSYSEQQDGNLLFAIKGEWKKNETWKIEYDQDAIAEGKELKQSHKEAQFEFTPKEGKSGYSEYFIELFDTNSQEKLYTFVVPIMLSQDEKISVLNIFFYAPLEESIEADVDEDVKVDTEVDKDEDSEETDFEDEETLMEKGVRLISWEYPEPVENSLVFSHIAYLCGMDVLPLLGISFLALLAMLFFVKKQAVCATGLDRVCKVCNILIILLFLPLATVSATFSDIIGSSQALDRQLFYIAPAFTVLGVAASVGLRRKGMEKAGILAPFIGPALFGLSLLLEAIC